MNYTTFKRIKILITSFVAATVAIAVVYNNLLLALAGVLIGMMFLFLVRKKSKTVLVDERVKLVGGYAARMTYIILTVTTGVLSLIFTSAGQRSSEPNYEILGIVLSYLTLLSVALYSISYKYYSKKYGGEDDKQN
ncbi:MAG: DUF2178 domain-containing protein [Patescibacteria group bacterium]|nr:DUF2178 domain-containing protein [Patescibacteria group bacterium]MDD5121192.1 DUF2178 domain-containing protein [Patescibacteria group bacterium]MDD5222004.1 DUF2178 domain-containing protein [Patescibacteria group bacterium]MDD5395889.1 DUF2178 domain-containing protein [Patescibacteria group bacterium]